MMMMMMKTTSIKRTVHDLPLPLSFLILRHNYLTPKIVYFNLISFFFFCSLLSSIKFIYLTLPSHKILYPICNFLPLHVWHFLSESIISSTHDMFQLRELLGKLAQPNQPCNRNSHSGIQ